MKKRLLAMGLVLSLLLGAAGCAKEGSSGASSDAADSSSSAVEEETSSSASQEAEAEAGDQEETVSSDTIKIGALLPLTGEVAAAGEEAKQAIEFIQDEINEAGGINGRMVEFVVEDDAGTPATAVTAAEKLVKIDGVSALVGPLFGSCILAIKEMTEDAQVPVITPTANADDLFSEGGYVFSIDLHPTAEMKLYANYIINNLGKKTVATLAVFSDATENSLKYFNQYIDEMGGSVIDAESFNQGEDDYSAEISKIKAANPDVLVLYADTQDGIKIIRQMKELDCTIPIITDHQVVQEDFLDNVGEIVDGYLHYVVTDQVIDEESLKARDAFNKAFEDAKGVQPGNVASLTYDCCQIIEKAMAESGETSGAALRDALSTTSIAGVTGPLEMSNTGISSRAGIMMKYADGESTPVETIVG